MSSSPADQDWLDDTMPLPQAGLIWPWILAGSILFLVGVFLLLPNAQDRPRGVSVVSTTNTSSQTPDALPAQPLEGTLECLVVDSESSSFGLAAERLNQLLRQGSDGKLGLTVHVSGLYNGKKYDELAIIDEVRQGRAQMAIVTSSPLTNFSSAFEVLDLPFLFQNEAQADRVMDGPIGQKLLSSLTENDLVGLGFLEVGFRVFSTATPLPSLQDFKGRKVRVMQSSMAIKMARQLGCEAVPAPVDKIYQMGKEGYIDAADRTYPTYWDFKLYEVHRYITESRHSYTTKVIIVNKQAYEALSEEERKILRESVEIVKLEQRKQQRLEDERVKQECRKLGIQIFELSPAESQQFLEACEPLYSEFNKLRGPELVESIRKENLKTDP